MRRITRKRLAGTLAALALLAGGTLAAVTAARPAGHHARGGAAAAAAGYLDMSAAQLRAELRSGRSLAQLATARGRSTAGLIETIVSARRARLQAELANLQATVTAQVQRPGGAAAARARPARLAARNALPVASYLGIASRDIAAKLRSGMTLAQIADATPGRSRAGLIAALTAARTKLIEGRLAAGKLTPQRERKLLAKLPARVAAFVDRPHARARHARAARPLSG